MTTEIALGAEFVRLVEGGGPGESEDIRAMRRELGALVLLSHLNDPEARELARAWLDLRTARARYAPPSSEPGEVVLEFAAALVAA